MEQSHPERAERATDAGDGVGPRADGRAQTKRWNYTTGVIFYHEQSKPPLDLSSANVEALEPGASLPGVVCQAARELLGLTQLEFSKLSDVSKKTLNDYENQKVEPRGRVVRALREALENRGARFYRSGEAIGVLVSRTQAKHDGVGAGP